MESTPDTVQYDDAGNCWPLRGPIVQELESIDAGIRRANAQKQQDINESNAIKAELSKTPLPPLGTGQLDYRTGSPQSIELGIGGGQTITCKAAGGGVLTKEDLEQFSNELTNQKDVMKNKLDSLGVLICRT